MESPDLRPSSTPEIDARLRREDLGLPPRQLARLAARDDLRRALATALRLVWSPETWAARQGEELCRALAASEPIAREVLLAPLKPTDGGAAVNLGDGPWLPLALLARLAGEARERGEDPWGESVERVEITGTLSATLPPLPERLRALSIVDAAELRPPAGEAEAFSLPALETLHVRRSPRAEPWRSSSLLGHRGWVSAIGWHRSGSIFATAGSDAIVRLWSPRVTGAEELSLVAELEGHARPIVALDWNPRALELATASPDGTVRVWGESAGRWHERAALTHPAEVTALAWSPDGLRLATVADDPIVRVWAIASRGWGAEELVGHAGLVQQVAWAPDGVRLASAGGDGTARLWLDGGGGFEAGGVLTAHDDWVRALTWLPAGNGVVTGSDDGSARLIVLRSGALARLRKTPAREGDTISLAGHGGWVRQVAVDRSGSVIATTCDDGILRLYDAEAPTESDSDRRERAPIATVEHPARITALESPHLTLLAPCTFLTGDDHGTLRVVRVGRGREREKPAEVGVVEGVGHDGTIGAIAVHPTSAELWSGSDDRTARVWRSARSGLGPAWERLLFPGDRRREPVEGAE